MVLAWVGMTRPSERTPRQPRVMLLGANGTTYDVFEVVSYEGNKLVVKGPLLFEIGETLRLKLERDGNISELMVRIDAHTGTGDEVHTSITVVEVQPVKRMVSG
jgi:hypothetical protein